MNKLPDLTQEQIRHVNATPDKEYPIRILKAYRKVKNLCKQHELMRLAGKLKESDV